MLQVSNLQYFSTFSISVAIDFDFFFSVLFCFVFSSSCNDCAAFTITLLMHLLLDLVFGVLCAVRGVAKREDEGSLEQ